MFDWDTDRFKYRAMIMERVARKAIADRLTDWNLSDCHLGNPSWLDGFDVVDVDDDQVTDMLRDYVQWVEERLLEE